MTTESINEHSGNLAGQRRARRRGLVVLAAAVVVALLVAFGDAEPPREGVTLADPQPVQMIEDWRGNSATLRPVE
jgi:hypothetical protein